MFVCKKIMVLSILNPGQNDLANGAIIKYLKKCYCAYEKKYSLVNTSDCNFGFKSSMKLCVQLSRVFTDAF